MALPTFKNLAVMTVSGTPGTGTITLGAAVPPYLSLTDAGILTGQKVTYSIIDGTSGSEIGQGTYTTSGTTLTRDTVYRSTGSGNTAKISVSSAAIVEITIAAEDVLNLITPNFRNILIANGGLEVWQRGAGGSASFSQAASTPGYTADRWYFFNGATQASVIDQVAGLSTQSRFAARVRRNSGQTGTGVMRFEYPLTTEECIALRGQNITFQAWLATGANWSPSSGNLVVNAYFGTGTERARAATGFTGETNPLSTTLAIAAGTAGAQSTFTGGSAVATNVTQGCLQFSWTPVGTAGAADDFTVDDVQLEVGTAASVFERLSFAAALAECRRHYFKTFSYSTAPAQNAGLTGAVGALDLGTTAAGTAGGAWVNFPVLMRTTPTCTVYNPSAANTKWSDASLSGISNAGDGGVTLTMTPFPLTQQMTYIHLTADAGL